MDVAARCRGKAGRKRERRGLRVIDTGDIDVFLGLDVGKGEHHARVPLEPVEDRRDRVGLGEFVRPVHQLRAT